VSEKIKVLIAPLVGLERHNWINPDLAMNLVTMAGDPRFETIFEPIRDRRPVEVARNCAIVAARDANADWCLQLDNDCFSLPGTALDVIATADPNRHSIIGLTSAFGGVNPAKKEAQFTLIPSGKPIAQEGRFLEVSVVGGAALAIHRTVWERIKGPWFRWEHGTDNETLAFELKNGCTEDISFCRLAKKNGFKIWTHEMQLCGHYRNADLLSLTTTLAFLNNRAQLLEKSLRQSVEADKWGSLSRSHCTVAGRWLSSLSASASAAVFTLSEITCT
jgi:glycosyltransferase involved in cell wall biosynthesis